MEISNRNLSINNIMGLKGLNLSTATILLTIDLKQIISL